VHNGRDSTPEILRALQKGFRHIDTARLYGNEQCVGKAIAQWEGGTRKDLFIQGKWGESEDKDYEHDPERSLMKSLELLGTDYIDLCE
jgi:diketogulonate reductase-like aldo/keto reductase